MAPFKIKPDAVDIFDDVVPPELYQRLFQVSRRVGWNYGWNTPSNPSARYWHHEIGFGNKQNQECIAQNVRKHPAKVFARYLDWLLDTMPEGTSTLRFYLNAYTFGTDGWPHTDTDRTSEQTVILYLTEPWNPAWSGDTALFDDKGDVTHSVLPRPNRMFSFPSNLLHAPRPLARAYMGLRVVLVAKFGFHK